MKEEPAVAAAAAGVQPDTVLFTFQNRRIPATETAAGPVLPSVAGRVN